MATLWLKVETVLHYGLPFRPVWPWSLAFCADLPVDDQMRDFVRDGLFQEIIEIFRKELLVDTQAGLTVALNSGLAGTATAQGEVDYSLWQFYAVKITGTFFCLADGCFCLMPKVCVCWFDSHES